VRTVEFVILTFDKATGRGFRSRRLDRGLVLVLVVVVVSGGGDPITKDGVQIVLDLVVVLVLFFRSGVTGRTGALFILIFVVGLISFICTSRGILTGIVIAHLAVEVADIQLHAVLGRVVQLLARGFVGFGITH
jgi:hypothetical protein